MTKPYKVCMNCGEARPQDTMVSGTSSIYGTLYFCDEECEQEWLD
jgi:predicted nucleic acid-binding Zn ribbon protein